MLVECEDTFELKPNERQFTPCKDTVQTLNSYKNNRIIPDEFKDLPNDSNEAITKLCFMYRDKLSETNLPDKEKNESAKLIITEIYVRVFFLLPYHIRKHSGKFFSTYNHSLFEDIIQNMSLNVLTAIQKFDPGRATKFSNYGLMYLREALFKSLKACNVVSPKNLRKFNTDYLETLAKEEINISTPGESTAAAQDASSPYCENGSLAYGRSSVKMGVTNSSKTYVCFDSGEQHAVERTFYDESKDCLEVLYDEEMMVWLRYAVDPKNKILSEQESVIVKHHFGIFGCAKLRLKDLAEFRKNSGKGSATTRVFQIEQSALAKLRRYFKAVGVEYTPS